MATIAWKTQAELDAEAARAQLWAEIQAYERAINERQQAYLALLTTDASQEELDSCKAELQQLLDAFSERLEVLRSA